VFSPAFYTIGFFRGSWNPHPPRRRIWVSENGAYPHGNGLLKMAIFLKGKWQVSAIGVPPNHP
jgi:hypothetical protein